MANWNELFKGDEFILTEPNSNFIDFFENLEKKRKINNIIDLGCGTGRHSIYLADKGYKVHAVDSSQNALDHLKKNTAHNIKMTLCNLTDMSMIKDHYDLGICINVLSHGTSCEIEKMFGQIENIMEDNGFLFLILTSINYAEHVKKNDTREIEKNSFLNIDSPDGDIVHHFFSEEEIKHILRNYRKVEIKNIIEYSPWSKKDVEHLMATAKK